MIDNVLLEPFPYAEQPRSVSPVPVCGRAAGECRFAVAAIREKELESASLKRRATSVDEELKGNPRLQ